MAHLGNDTSVFADLSVAVGTRNWLAHDYFRERATEFGTWTGRRQMLVELKAIADRFEDLDWRLHLVLLTFGRAHGITQPTIDAIYAEMRASSDLVDNQESPPGGYGP